MKLPTKEEDCDFENLRNNTNKNEHMYKRLAVQEREFCRFPILNSRTGGRSENPVRQVVIVQFSLVILSNIILDPLEVCTYGVVLVT